VYRAIFDCTIDSVGVVSYINCSMVENVLRKTIAIVVLDGLYCVLESAQLEVVLVYYTLYWLYYVFSSEGFFNKSIVKSE
jgi:hypothetical protein